MSKIIKAFNFWWSRLGKKKVSKVEFHVCENYSLSIFIDRLQNNPDIHITSVSVSRSSDSGGSGWKDRYAFIVSYDVWI